MKRLFTVLVAFLIITVLVFSGCGGAAKTTSPSAPPSGTTPAGGTPVSGGTLRIIGSAIPKDLGYGPEKAPSDSYLMLPVIEHLCEWGDTSGNLKGILCDSWDVDSKAKTITWHLHKNIKFTDGTDFDAEALRWNFQFSIDHATLTSGQFIESLEVKDNYTLILHMQKYDWTMVMWYGLLQPMSPTAYLTAGGSIPSGSDEEKSKDWARSNVVGTGPFTVSEWVRDDHITFVKNPNYWQPGKPYLDKIIMRAITDDTVCEATMEAGEADMWMDTGSVENINTLQGKGLKINWGPGYFDLLLMSSANEDNPLSNIKVREAIEYALDRPTMAQQLGQGLYEPLTQMASKTWPGYVQGYDPRPFSTEKAKSLLKEAGYANGLTLKILASSGSATNDAMALFVYYLGLAGITVEPDIADLGRYYGSLFGGGPGWDDIAFTAAGINPDASDLFVHYGPNPATFNTTNIWKSDKYKQLCDAALDPSYKSAADAMPKIKEAVKQAGEDCIFVPLWRTAEACITQTYVHTEYPKIHGIIWQPYNDWVEAH